MEKDITTLKNIREAANFAVSSLSKTQSHLLNILDKEIKSTNTDVSTFCKRLLKNPEKSFGKKNMKNVTPESLTFSYEPSVQSGSSVNVNLSAEIPQSLLKSGIVVISIGMAVDGCHADVARTILISPTENQKKYYQLLVQLQKKVVGLLVDGAVLGEIYDSAFSEVMEKAPELETSFLMNCGFSTGKEYIESDYKIERGNTNVVHSRTIYVIRLGLSNILDGDETYSMLLADTLLISGNKSKEFTSKAKKELERITFNLNEDRAPLPQSKDSGSKFAYADYEGFSLRKDSDVINFVEVGRRRLRNTPQREILRNTGANFKLENHQKKLGKKIEKEVEEQIRNGTFATDENEYVLKDPVSYKNGSEYPSVKMDRIFVDQRTETVLVPIFGKLTPFHISCVHRIAYSGKDHLRIIFKHPQRSQPKGELPRNYENPHIPFLSEVSYRFHDQEYLKLIHNSIVKVKRNVIKRENRAFDRHSLQEQPSLIINRAPTIPKLTGLLVKPKGKGRRKKGTLEAHKNGFRYRGSGENIDIIYNNIKHAFFERSHKTLKVLVHFHLHDEILVNNTTKTKDIQCYTEVGESSYKIGGQNDRYDSEDYERKMIRRTNMKFEKFVEEVENTCFIKFEEPNPEEGFIGSPGRNNVLISPTPNCLVHLDESPWFVLSLEEVHIAFFERVQLSLKNFDLTFIPKNFSKEIHVTAIDMRNLEVIKTWLDKNDIKFFESQKSIAWNSLLQYVRQQPENFFGSGGWAQIAKAPESMIYVDEGDAYVPEDMSVEESDDYFEKSGEEQDNVKSEPVPPTLMKKNIPDEEEVRSKKKRRRKSSHSSKKKEKRKSSSGKRKRRKKKRTE